MKHESFDEFLARREVAARAYAEGDPDPMRNITALSGTATAFTRDGGFARGARAVNEANIRMAEDFEAGGTTRYEIEDCGADGDVGYWTGFQHSEIVLAETGEHRPVRLRVTEVYRRIEGEWQRVHRHASPANA